MNPATIKRKMLAVYALATRAEGAERETALDILRQMEKKHAIYIEDIGNQKQFCRFSYKTRLEKDILFGIVRKLRNESTVSYFVKKTEKNKVQFELTEKERIVITVHFDLLREAWKEQSKIFFNAFIYKNNLFAKNESETGERYVDPVSEPAPELSTLSLYYDAIEKTEVLSRIGGGS